MTAAGRILVAGAGGFIGRWSVAPLLLAGYEVHAVLCNPQRAVPLELNGASLHYGDLLEPRQQDELLRTVSPTHLLHFAWIATPGVYWQSPDNARWLAASKSLVEKFYSQGGRRAVLAGSCAEYDWHAASLCDEASSPLLDPANPSTSPYAACKIELQRWLAEFSRSRGLSSAWGRIFFQFGPYEHPDRLVASVIGHLLKSEPAPCSEGRQVRSFLHTADVGAAFAALLDSGVEGAVNVGSAEPITVADLIGRIAANIGAPEWVRLGARASPAGEPAVLLPAVHRLRDEVGWHPRLSLTDGLDATIAWWRSRLA